LSVRESQVTQEGRHDLTDRSPPSAPSRQHPQIPPLKPIYHRPQGLELDNLKLIAPLVEMPDHLDPTGRGELDEQAAIWLIGHLLRRMEFEISRDCGCAGRKAPHNATVLCV